MPNQRQLSELDAWLKSRDHLRPYIGSIQKLAKMSYCGQTVVYDASWGQYRTIPEALSRWISQEDNEIFRANQRADFVKLELDWPVPFQGFRALAEFWDSSLSGLAKTFGIQRPIMGKFDAAPSLLYKEINEVIATCAPPDYFRDHFLPFCTASQPAPKPARPKPDTTTNPLAFLERLKQGVAH